MKRKFFATKTALTISYNKLKSLQAVADKYGVSKKLILNYMNKFGIDRKKPINKSEIIGLIETGLSHLEVSKLYKVSRERICQICIEAEMPTIDTYHKGYCMHNGYKLLPAKEHPFANSKGYVQKHRLVMEKHIGRILTKDELVHHINGVKLDNRIENLQIMTIAEHVSLHHTGKKGRGPDKKKRKTKKPPHSCEIHHT